MSKIEITYRQLLEFNHASDVFIERNKDNNTKQVQMFITRLKSVKKQIRKDEYFEDYNEKIMANQLACCLTEEKTGKIIKEFPLDGKGNPVEKYTYNADGQKKLSGLSKDLLKETVEIHQRIEPVIDVELNDYEREAFEGIVIPVSVEEG